MSAGEKLVGVGAALMVVCCALLPALAAAVGGGLVAGAAGTIGIVCGVLLLGGVGVFLWRRRRAGLDC